MWVHVSSTLKGRQSQGLEFMFLHPFQSNRKKKWRKWIALGLCLSLLKEGGKTLARLLQFSPRPEPCSVHRTSFLRLMMCAPLIESNRLSLHEEFAGYIRHLSASFSNNLAVQREMSWMPEQNSLHAHKSSLVSKVKIITLIITLYFADL